MTNVNKIAIKNAFITIAEPHLIKIFYLKKPDKSSIAF